MNKLRYFSIRLNDRQSCATMRSISRRASAMVLGIVLGIVLAGIVTAQEKQETKDAKRTAEAQSAKDVSRIESAQGIKNLTGADLDLMSDHDPASELENFELLDGYQVNLFASDPMIANPVHMHWDSRGRLWVACSWAYPQLKPGEVADDKIIILEDTDNDGAADKSTIFADGLYLPTGLELANGGCYVAQSPDVFFLKDTDGDDVADVKVLALTGFGIEDSHHSISAWRRGPGGWIYFQEGIFLHSQVETQHGVVRNFNGGVYQFNPRTQELRVFCTGTGGNPWGHIFDPWGQSFMVNNPRIMYLSPATGNSGEKIRIRPLISTEKQCGGDLATGTHVGDDIRGNLLSGRFKSRTIIRYELMEDGAGYSANVLEPLMTTKHPNFRPVDVKVGPDGAIYVADWYNSIINHAQHDFRDPRRDHQHGRIWRITHQERPLVVKPKLVGIPISELVDHLKSPETWIRHQARKELSERDPDEVLSAVEQWVDGLAFELPNYDHHLVEAMWACQNVERASEKILRLVMNADDGRARAAGARTIRYWHGQLSDPIAMVAKACDDTFPRTRMEAVLSAGYIPQAEAYVAALNSLDHPGDPFLDQALPQTRIALEKYWRPALKAGTLRFEKDAHRAFAEQEAGIGFEIRLARFLATSSPSDKEIDGVCEQLRTVGTDEDVQIVVAALTKGNAIQSSAAKIALLETLKQMAASHRARSIQRRMRGLTKLLDADNEAVAILAADNLGIWGVPRVTPALSDLVADGDRSTALRRSAAVALAKLGTDNDRERLVRLSKQGDSKSRYAALAGLIAVDLNRGVQLAASLLGDDPHLADPVPLIQAIVTQRRGAGLLVEALRDVKIHPEVRAKVSHFHRVSGTLSPKLASRFRSSSGSVSLTKQLLREDPGKLASDVEQFGDPVRGELVYRRKALACTSCHAIGSAGPQIGPNLVAVGAAAKTGYIVESILEPDKAIAEHYENRLFVLDDGTTQAGIVTFKSEKEIVVRDAALAGKEVRLPMEAIIAEKPLQSAMPAGLADQLSSRQEFLDLAKFVALLGRPGAYANVERPVIRKWRVVSAPAGNELPSETAPWVSAYSKVSGQLPSEDFPAGDHVFAQGHVIVQAAGAVKLSVNHLAGLRIWLDGKELLAPPGPIELTKGRSTLTFAIDRHARGDRGLRVELVPIAGSPAKYRPQGGL